MHFEFRVDKDERQLPVFAVDTADQLGHLLGRALTEAGFDFQDFSSDLHSQLERWRACTKPQCILGLRDAQDSVRVAISLLRASAAVVVTVMDTALLREGTQIEGLKTLLEGCFDQPDSMSIQEYSAASLAVLRSPDFSTGHLRFLID